MEGRVLLRCGECELTREIVGEIPDEYIRSFELAVREDGWVPRPGANHATKLICRTCLVKNYEGHESVDDGAKVQGLENPKG